MILTNKFTFYGLSTLFGLKKRGFFIPYLAAEICQDTLQPHPHIKKLFQEKQKTFLSELKKLDKFMPYFHAIHKDGEAPHPRWNQDWFPRLDAMMLYMKLAQLKPHHIIEIGCGHSTRFIQKAIEDHHLYTKHICIDPSPRTTLPEGITHLKLNLQDVTLTVFDNLHAQDIIFIDSSHIFMPGTDMSYFFTEILARLPQNIHLHFHDIFLPEPYPLEWQDRNYNEQEVIASHLISQSFELVSSSYYITEHMQAAFHNSQASQFFLKDGAYESSLWVRKNF